MSDLLTDKEKAKAKLLSILKEEQLRKNLANKWSQLNESEQQFALQFTMFVSPKFRKNLLEQEEKDSSFLSKAADYGQFGLDVIGVFDPTGIADAINALWYFGRGEYLFGMLSLVSVIPYVGDVLAKPVLLFGKASLKAIKPIIATKNATKIAQGVTKLKGTKSGSYLYKFFYEFESKVAPKLIESLTELEKNKVVGGLAKTAKSWVEVFLDASKQIKVPTKSTKLGAQGTAGVLLRNTDKIDFAKTIDMILSPSKGGIKAFRTAGSKPSWFKLGPVEFKKIWKVPKLRKTIGKTKGYLRFLDYMGIGNFIGPEDLVLKVGEDAASKAFTEFSQTNDGKQMYENELFSELPETSPELEMSNKPEQIEKPQNKQDDAFSALYNIYKLVS